jgi:tRNA(fMet)-specific endonuclease VapC
MSLWILDTDHVSLLLNEHPLVSRKVMAIGADVEITIVTVQEVFNGWIVRINVANELEEIIRLYSNLNRTVALFKRLSVLNFDVAAGNCYKQMLQSTPALAKKSLAKGYANCCNRTLSWGNCSHSQLSRFRSSSRSITGRLDSRKLMIPTIRPSKFFLSVKIFKTPPLTNSTGYSPATADASAAPRRA